MRKQVELKYFIGYNVANPDADAAMIQAACAVCGGCFVADGTGYWVNGDTHAERFDGEAESEHCLNICLTTELEKLEGVIQFMEFEIARIVHDHQLDVEWVHVQQFDIVGRHFNVKEVLEVNGVELVDIG